MCDCYYHECDHVECDAEIDMHLEDFSTPREDVEVFCGRHIPPKSERAGGVLWGCHNRRNAKWKKVFIRALSRTAQRHSEGNHPNCSYTKIFEDHINPPKDTP